MAAPPSQDSAISHSDSGYGTRALRTAASAAHGKTDLREARDEFEREFIRAALARNDWDKTRTAEELGIQRTHLHRKLHDLGLTE